MNPHTQILSLSGLSDGMSREKGRQFMTRSPSSLDLVVGESTIVCKSQPYCFTCMHRACPGRDLAERLLFTAIASTLLTFDIGCQRGENGKDIVPPEAYSDGGMM